MLHIGCHLSTSGGFAAMGNTARSLDADTFAFFTRNPRGGGAKPVEPHDAAELLELCRRRQFAPLVAHGSYTMNLCSSDPSVRDFARRMLVDDLQRMEFFPGSYYNFHPGSHTGQGAEAGTTLIGSALAPVLSAAPQTIVLLETMAGKGSEVGSTFEELREIIIKADAVSSPCWGICFDTCHVHDAGYDIINNLDGVLEQFDRILGVDRLKAVHLNDSMNPAGSRKDRHACIGAGCIGLDALVRIIRHPVLKNLPFILETPNELPGYAAEIALLRSRAEQ